MRQISIIGVLFILITSNCKKQDENKCFKSNGNIIEQERSLDYFTKIVVNDKINLIIKEDTINHLKIKTPENLVNFILTEIKDDVLYISNENKCNWLRRFDIAIDIELFTTSLREIECRGAGIIKTNGFLVKDFFELNVHDASSRIELMLKANNSNVQLHNGCSDIFITGCAQNNMIYNAGTGNIYLQNFDTKATNIRHKGTGQCYVKVSDYLTAILEYVGDIHYFGNPINKELIDNGEGEIIQH